MPQHHWLQTYVSTCWKLIGYNQPIFGRFMTVWKKYRLKSNNLVDLNTILVNFSPRYSVDAYLPKHTNKQDQAENWVLSEFIRYEFKKKYFLFFFLTIFYLKGSSQHSVVIFHDLLMKQKTPYTLFISNMNCAVASNKSNTQVGKL